MEALEGVGFTHYAVSNHYFLGVVVQVGYVKNLVSLSKNIFSASNFFMHIFNMSVTYLQKCWKDAVKALRGVDFTKYALSTIIY